MIIDEIKDFKDFGKVISYLSQIAPFLCMINMMPANINEIEKMGCQEYSLQTRKIMPKKLYKYFPNTIEERTKANYSIQALRDNTVYMQTPNNFDDVYDSDINIDFEKYQKLRLIEYCSRCGIEVDKTLSMQEIGNIFLNVIYTSFKNFNDSRNAFIQKPDSEIKQLSNELFCTRLEINLRENNNDLGIAIGKTIFDEFNEFNDRLKNTFRVTCFATTPYSQLMWGGAYADCHRGFCLEYEILPNEEKYQEIYQNLYPMIYCKIRPDITERLIKIQDERMNKDALWNIYFHGALRKSIDWAFQNEWRLLLPMEKNQEASKYCMPFFPITKVYLGNRMPPIKRKEIIDICNEKNIHYIGVKRKSNVFEMEDCAIKCEECFKYKNNLHK